MSQARRTTATSSEPLLKYLIASLGLKRKTAKNLLKHDAVAVNGRAVRQFDHLLAAGDEVSIGAMRTAVAADRLKRARIEVVYQDDDVLVVEKPAGLLTVATDRVKLDTLFVRLNDFLRNTSEAATGRAFVVHRLDQETSGLVLFAKNAEARERLQADWPNVQKTYLAIVVGRPEPDRGTITSYLVETKALTIVSSDDPAPDARLAETHYRCWQSRGDFSLVEARLETGRRHQIRVHLAGLNCPIAGDHRYGAKLDPCRRLALHAQQLVFRHPSSGKQITVNSQLPSAMQRLFPNWNRVVE